jgi:pterin-4a-carbinolamine dehydratase
MSQQSASIFISYRRQDSSAAARWLQHNIQRALDSSTVFLDIDSSDLDWRERVSQTLKAASLLIPVIGPNWIGITDKVGRRRIDLEDDSVRIELTYALANGLTVIPVLLNSASVPGPELLPRVIRPLSELRAFSIKEGSWRADFDALLSHLVELGFKKSGKEVRYRKPCLALYELSDQEIDEQLVDLPHWKRVTSDLSGKEALKQIEINRTFEFPSFEDAIDFMAESAKHISEIDHHPRWENRFRTVEVWLTTWDIGHRISQSDFGLARYLENVYSRYSSGKA